ncbi:unnamed protein product, partial [Effrenium voratum]
APKPKPVDAWASSGSPVARGALCACSPWEAALHWARPAARNSLAGNAAVSACSVGLAWVQALDLLRWLPRPDRVAWGAAFSGAAPWAQALQLLRRMAQRRLQAEAICSNACASALGRRWHHALRLVLAEA